MKMFTKSTAPQWKTTDPNDYLLWLSWRWKELVHNRRKLSKGCLSLHCITVIQAYKDLKLKSQNTLSHSSRIFANTGSRIHLFNSFASSIVLDERVFYRGYIQVINYISFCSNKWINSDILNRCTFILEFHLFLLRQTQRLCFTWKIQT